MRRTTRLGRAALAISFFAAANAAAQAQEDNPAGIELTRVTPQEYVPGQSVEVQVIISAQFEGVITAMGLTETIPPGWTFNGMGSLISGILPNITPAPGKTDQLDFAWFTIPQEEFPYQFTYYIDVPASAAGPAAINGFVEYREDGPAHFSNEFLSQLNGEDKEPPVITLNGEDPMIVFVGDPFADPGATATDNVDGNVRVTATGSVNTSAPGVYTITYTAVDSSGNRADPVTRTVEVRERPDDGDVGGGVPPPTPRTPPTQTMAGGGGIYIPDTDAQGRTLPPDARPGPDAAPGQVAQRGADSAASPRQPGQQPPTRLPEAPPSGAPPVITPTRPQTPADDAPARPGGEPRLRQDAGAEASPGERGGISPGTPAGADAPTAADAPAIEAPEGPAPWQMARVREPYAAAPEESPVSEPAAARGGIAAAWAGLGLRERLSLAVLGAVVLGMLLAAGVAYRFAYKGAPRRTPRT